MSVLPEDDRKIVHREMSLDERSASRWTAKKAIGRFASALVKAGDPVLMEVGSTCLQAALNLVGREDVPLVTNSLPLLEAGRHGHCRLICLGGELRRVSGALTGAPRSECLNACRVTSSF